MVKKKVNSLNYLTPSEEHWACDIEADNLLDKATTIWCVCLLNCVTKKRLTFTKAGDFTAWLEQNTSAVFVGHNFIAYDLPMLNRHWNSKIGISRVVDTFVLSQLYNPSYAGGHSLEAWGLRLKYPKTSFSDFSRYTPEMAKYCMNDTILTAYLYRKLTERMTSVGFTEEGCEIEHLAWSIIQNKQKRAGCPFDFERANVLYVTLRDREEELKREIYKLWPPSYEAVATFKAGKKKDGSRTANYERHLGQFPELRDNEDGGYTAFDYVPFDLGSSAQRIEKLLALGWVPVEFTPKTDKGGGGNPKVDEDSLLAYAELTGRPELKALAKWIVINSRANMIRTWLNAYDPDTGCIHGSVFMAATLRYRHSNPNTANIPAARTKKVDGEDQILMGEEGAYCYEVRDLWTCGDPTEWTQVGLDGTGIQARVLANYCSSPSFNALVLSGDIHKHNIEVLGLVNKAAAKKFFYTFVMGGGGARLAADQAQFGTKMTASQGEALKKKYISSIHGFGDAIKKLKLELANTGRIVLCDGTPILVPSPHMVIPYLLQGDESRLMKKALVFLYQELKRTGLEKHVKKSLDVHDEWQFRVKNEVVDQFIALALPCFRKAGEFFNYKLPIDGDAKRGKTWAETH